MYLKSLELHHFRNFRAKTCAFSPGITLFTGPNAAGKTNLLEAIHLLSNLRSFRTHALRELIQWDEADGYVRGIVHPGNGDAALTEHPKTLAVAVKANARVPVINSKPCRTSKDYLRLLPSATFAPDDLSLVKGAPALRRYFIDHGTFLFSAAYWMLLTDYNRVLLQKNTLLKEFQRKGARDGERLKSLEAACEVWDAQLQAFGSKILAQRLIFVSRLQRLIAEVYARWLGTDETITLRYKFSIAGAHEEARLPENGAETPAFEQIAAAYAQAIRQNRERERRLGTTVIGPHRDDLEIFLAGRPLRAYGSQGQQRTAVLALKLAEIHLYFEQYGEYPLLLLDDVTSELDLSRNAKLLEYLQSGMQVFLTATETRDLAPLRGLSCEYIAL